MRKHISIAEWERVATREVTSGDVTLRVYDHGEGRPDRPPVVLCHGFPELAFSWRAQLFALAEAGYRVLVPDMRGYGGSSRPADVDAYDILSLCGDLAAILDDVGADDAVFVGHDWGANVVWQMALAHPERVRAVAGMSVPVSRRAPAPPLPILRERLGDDFYMVWFQEPGVADEALRRDVRRTLVTKEIYSARWAARTELEEDELTPPPWLDADELAYYVDTFEATGFSGGLNYYRNLDRNWALTEHLAERRVTQPSLFVTGSKDPVAQFMPAKDLGRMLTDRRGTLVIDGAGHWIQQQRPDEVNAALLEFLSEVG
ncbi:MULTISPECIES: alpha/beta hydrolase [unclassified Streptomyces]|uniref:alpha/beta fold hydrolase n=1 Tax=unclassified Streptomyces TaxID=2593676 RepID=UPI0033DA220C